MMRSLTLATALTTVFALSAMAADTTTKVDPAVPAVGTAAPTATSSAAPAQAKPTMPSDSIVLTEEEGKNWLNKPIYTADGSDIGKVVDFQRNADNKVTSMHADIGGFLGFDQTRVNLTTPQFKLQGDRVVLTLTAAEVKALPAVKI